MGILDVLHFPDSRLRRPSEPVEKITDEIDLAAYDVITQLMK
jgi:peptide deformylase